MAFRLEAFGFRSRSDVQLLLQKLAAAVILIECGAQPFLIEVEACKATPLDGLLSAREYEALLDEARDGLAAFRNGDGSIAMPIAAHIVTARKG